jgi:hypothetical protein
MWRCPLSGEGEGGENYDGGGDGVAAMSEIANFLIGCNNLVEVKMTNCRIRGDVLPPLLLDPTSTSSCGALLQRLTKMDMDCNDIGNGGGGDGNKCGCDVIATALRDPSCALRVLRLCRNSIDESGIVRLAGSLTHNDILEELYLDDNPGSRSYGSIRAFSDLLCDRSTINSTYLSNHTLRVLGLGGSNVFIGEVYCLESNLELNSSSYRPSPHPSVGFKISSRSSDVGITKILRNHPRIDVSSLLEWDIRLLPHVVDWFDRATPLWEYDKSTRSSKYDVLEIDIDTRKRGAMYEFVRALPTTWYASIYI